MNEKKKENLEDLVQNLKEAGCDGETIEQYVSCCGCGDAKGKEKLLLGRRRELLEDMHECQRKIDCLDYLRYQEKKTEKGRQ